MITFRARRPKAAPTRNPPASELKSRPSRRVTNIADMSCYLINFTIMKFNRAETA
jgi:hypothetical protein